MPTPVSTARQCLTKEAARALDDAVAVARRRSHAQTTSLHAVSALLAMPSSVLRDVCVSRASRSTPYSSRLQFRALELCVGVSLDRLPSSKSPTAEEEPPVSNSLMAAIKRSQANQRRHPETYHLQQMHSGGGGAQTTTSVIKVELKYFILSILDDPIVSRVFGEAGFRSSDIKLDVLHPPVTQFSSRFSRARCPPLFLCNLPDSDPGRVSFGFPFSGNSDFDENCRRIGEVLARKEKKNPLLVGVCANEALKTFTDLMNRGKLGFMPLEFSGVSVLSIEEEITEILVDGSRNDEEIRKKLDELGGITEKKCSVSGLVLNLGEFKAFTCEASASNDNALESFVSKLSDLLKLHRENLWLIGSISSNETFPKLLDRFPTIEKDWDLHVLPITSTKPSGVHPRSSLMASFVPFGGFFSSTSDFRVPFSSTTNQPMPRCHLCNEKYEQEVASFVKVGSSVSVADQCLEKLPSWLRAAEPNVDSKGMDTKAKDVSNILGSRMAALQKKWDDICQRIHQTPAFPKISFQPAKPQFPVQLVPDQTEKGVRSPTEQISPSIHVRTPENFPGTCKTQIPSLSASSGFSFQSRLSVQVSKSKHTEDLKSPMTNRTTSSPLSCVTTDLGLGTIYASTSQEPKTPVSLDQRDLRASSEKPLLLTPPTSAEQISHKDFKYLREFLSQKVRWQIEAVNAISEILCGCKDDSRRSHGASTMSKSVWLALLGPDRVGKKKIASALAEIFFNDRENLICADFQAQDCLGDKFRGKTMVDYIAGELARRPHSVVLLENVEKAAFPDQISLSDAARTGKLRDLHGREISMKNVIVVATSGIVKDSTGHVPESVQFSEERVLSAKSWKLQIKLTESCDDVARISLNKRKQNSETETAERRAQKAQRSYLDLNLPVEETEANTDETDAMSENTEAWLEDFVEQVDGKVMFKPFDFDGLAKNIQRKIISHFHGYFGSEIDLEIDDDVIVQILGASWSSDEDITLEQWLQKVLGPSFLEARQKYGSTPGFAVKLVACGGFQAEEEAGGAKFPARVDVL